MLFRLWQIGEFPQIGFVGSLRELRHFGVPFQGTVNVNGFFCILYPCILCVRFSDWGGYDFRTGGRPKIGLGVLGRASPIFGLGS
jgi:hypothetical protein